ncbi:MAG TPA: ATP-binding cassette domain-containing protein [Stellaceae bacterium]|nr:ATP-binding cassette domain-containing protein [Stellaceae bacterium]
MTAIELRNVALRRGGRLVLSDVDAVIGEGEFIGVFGPNGAGKTTLLQALLGLSPPESGTLRVFGRPPMHGDPLAGYMPQRRSATAELGLCGWDIVASALHGHRWGLPILGAEGRREVAWALATVEATEFARRPIQQLSGGEVQRLLLAQALLGRPRLLLLDEPLISLDPRYQQAAVELVKRVQQELHMTVLFTAHELNPLLGAMDRVLYLGGGRAKLGTVDEVINTETLSRLYGAPIDVLRIDGRIIVVASHGAVEAHAHGHDA